MQDQKISSSDKSSGRNYETDNLLLGHGVEVDIGCRFSLLIRTDSIPRWSQVKFSIELPVQFRDIDVMGHVNNATYLQYMETARVELARHLGQLTDGIRPGFIIASARCEFKKPIRDERRITVSVWVSRIGDRSWDLDYSIHGPRGVEYAIGRTAQVAYNYKTGSAAKISGKLKRELAKYVEAPV